MAVADASGLQEPCTIYTNNVERCRKRNWREVMEGDGSVFVEYCLVRIVLHLSNWTTMDDTDQRM